MTGGATLLEDGTTAQILNNNFLGNKTLSSGDAAQLAIDAPNADVRNNVIAWGVYGAGVFVSTSGREGLVFRHNDVYENDEDYAGTDAVPAATEGNISLDPQFEELTLDHNVDNDDLRLQWDSPCAGAGDPDLAEADRLTSDIGVFGISDIVPIDGDDDGFSPESGEDCNDADPTIHIEADELCDDGQDNNCDGRIDEDCAADDTGSPEEDTGEPILEEDTADPVDTGPISPVDTGAEGPERENPPGSQPDTGSRDLYAVSGKGCRCTSTEARQVGLWWCLIPLIALRRWFT